MAQAIYRGIDNVAREVTKIYRGVDNVARQVKFGYRGISNVARRFYGNTNYVYINGDKCTEVHGGFVALATAGFGRGSKDWCSKPSITYNTSTVKISGHTSSYGSVFTKNKINISNYKTINFVVTATSNSGTCRVGVTTSNSYGYTGTYKDISSKASGTVSIDISSLTGNYYVAIEIDGNRTKTFSKIYFE